MMISTIKVGEFKDISVVAVKKIDSVDTMASISSSSSPVAFSQMRGLRYNNQTFGYDGMSIHSSDGSTYIGPPEEEVLRPTLVRSSVAGPWLRPCNFWLITVLLVLAAIVFLTIGLVVSDNERHPTGIPLQGNIAAAFTSTRKPTSAKSKDTTSTTTSTIKSPPTTTTSTTTKPSTTTTTTTTTNTPFLTTTLRDSPTTQSTAMSSTSTSILAASVYPTTAEPHSTTSKAHTTTSEPLSTTSKAQITTSEPLSTTSNAQPTTTESLSTTSKTTTDPLSTTAEPSTTASEARTSEQRISTVQTSQTTTELRTETPAEMASTTTDIDQCISDPCMNGGTCLDDVTGYNCTCKDGYLGHNCEIEGPCLAKPCQNSGRCLTLSELEYACICPYVNTSLVPVSNTCQLDHLFCLFNQQVSLHPHPLFCNQYVECSNNIVYEKTCPEPLLYDAIANRCREANQALCHQATERHDPVGAIVNVTSCDDIVCLNGGVCAVTSSGAHCECGATCGCGLTGERCEWLGDLSCIGRQDGYYSSTQDCNQFFQCTDQFASPYQVCGTSLVFDPTSGTCDFRQNVPCAT